MLKWVAGISFVLILSAPSAQAGKGGHSHGHDHGYDNGCKGKTCRPQDAYPKCTADYCAPAYPYGGFQPWYRQGRRFSVQVQFGAGYAMPGGYGIGTLGGGGFYGANPGYNFGYGSNYSTNWGTGFIQQPSVPYYPGYPLGGYNGQTRLPFGSVMYF